jgi:hypothetical protein
MKNLQIVRTAAMESLKPLSINVIALALATLIGAVVISQVAYVFHIYITKNPTTPLVIGFLIAVIIAAVAPRTAFLPRFLVFTGIFLLEMALYIVFTNAKMFLVERYWDGDVEAAKPLAHVGILIHIITFTAGLVVLRRHRLPKPTEIEAR